MFKEHNFFYPVELTYEEGAPFKKFPWIRPTDLLKSMAKLNDISHLLGGKQLHESADLLRDFWKKYRDLHPDHQLWEKRMDLSRCIPCLIHGDEGTTYKKNGPLVLSLQGMTGTGTSKRDMEKNYKAMGEGIPLNFLKTGMQTRLLMLVCPKDIGFSKHVVQS